MANDAQFPVETEREEEDDEWGDYPFRGIVACCDHDVLLRGKNSPDPIELYQQHTGNIRFQRIIHHYAQEYKSKNKIERPMVAAQILSQWRGQNPPGRFLKLDPETNLWHDIGAKRAREKISCMLKEGSDDTCNNKQGQSLTRNDSSKEKLSIEDGALSLSNLLIEGATLPRTSVGKDRRRLSAKLDCSRRTHRLYGREKEEQALVEMFTRQMDASSRKDQRDFCIISGPSGSGKTALAHSLRLHVHNLGGLFLQGKFERVGSHESFEVFSSAMADFARLVPHDDSSESIATMGRYRSAFLDTFSDQELRMLVAAVPGLHALIEADTVSVEREKGSHTAKLLTNMFQRFIQAIATQEMPLVVLFEELNWANEASLDLLAALLSDVENESIFFLATTSTGDSDVLRDSEDSITQAASGGLGRLTTALLAKQIFISSIRLDPIDETALLEMLSDVLLVDPSDRVADLCRLVHSMTAGNMLFVKELLRKLQDDDLVWFDEGNNSWMFDAHMIQNTITVRNVHDLLKQRFLEITPDAQETLKAASCLGSLINEALLARVFSSSVSSHLEEAATRGLLTFDRFNESFRFSHDTVLRAAYGLVPESERPRFHDKLGRKLWKSFEEKELDEHIFVVLDQLMAQETCRNGEEETVSSYCLRAAEKAFQMSMFSKAAAYLEYGIKQLGDHGWRHTYPLTLKLHNAAAEVACCTGQYVRVDDLVKAVLAHTRSFDDSLHARATYIHSLGSAGRPLNAIDAALSTLEKLNEFLPPYPSTFQTLMLLWRTKRLLRQRSDGKLSRLPVMSDKHKLASMQILSSILLHSLYARPSLLPIIACRMVTLTLDYGVCAPSSVGFAYYGMVLCSGGRDVEDGYHYGAIGLEMLDQFKRDAWLPRVTAAFYGVVCSWKISYKETLGPLKLALRTGLATGDVEYALLNWSIYCWTIAQQATLPELEREIRALTGHMDFFGQMESKTMIQPLWQSSLNLMGRSKDTKILSGSVMNQEDLTAFAKSHNQGLLLWICFYRAMIEYFLYDFDAAEKHMQGVEEHFASGYGGMDASEVLLYLTLTLLAQFRHRGKISRLKRARRLRGQLKSWSLHSPDNMLGKLFLIEAEIASCQGKSLLAVSKYKSAILHLREESLLGQEALGNELFANHCWESIGDEAAASKHFREARRLYEKWGASAKLDHLHKHMDSLGILC